MRFYVKLVHSLYNNWIDVISRARTFFWGLFLKRMGKGVVIFAGTKILSPNNVSIGNNVFIHSNCTLDGHGGLEIGNFAIMAENVKIMTFNHSYDDYRIPIRRQPFALAKVVIEEDVWIGSNAVILPNVTVGKGAIVGAGAVVAKNVAPFSIVGGVPAELIKYRFSEETINKAKKMDFENFPNTSS